MVDLGIEGISDPTRIGVGGFSDVYRATQVGLDRAVAVKVLRGAFDDTTLRRFKREIQTMAKVSQHPNVVTIYHAGISALQQPYLVMELANGGSLGDTLQSGPLDWAEAIDRTLPIASALAYIHRSGILHRDVKPANILVGDGSVKLTDFGIGHITDTSLPPTRAMTLQYSSPELFKNGDPDERSDLYSLGATLYALVGGAPPFGGVEQATETVVRRILDEPPPPVPAVPGALQRFLQRALAKEPDHRWPSAGAFAADLEACADDCRRELSRAGSPPAPPPQTPPPPTPAPAPPAPAPPTPTRPPTGEPSPARAGRRGDPAWDGLAGSASARDRREVARRTTNGKVLLALARDPEADVRQAAFDNEDIRDERLLWQLASVGDLDTRLAATELLAELTSIDALATDEVEQIRRVVAESTSDRSLLTNLAIDDSRQVRLAAMDRIDSPDLLRHLATDKERPQVSVDAFDRLLRLIPAAELATDDDPDIRSYYAERSTDETLLRHLSNDESPKVSGRARIRLFLEAAEANALGVPLHDHLDDRARAWLAEHGGFGDDRQPVIEALVRDRSPTIRRAARRRYSDTDKLVSQTATDELTGSAFLGAAAGALVGLLVARADSTTWGAAVLLMIGLVAVARAGLLVWQHGSSGLSTASGDLQLRTARALMTFLRPTPGTGRTTPERTTIAPAAPPSTGHRLTND